MGERVVVSKDPAREAGRLVAEAIAAADANTKAARLAVAGGSAAEGLRYVREALPADVWSRLRLTWADERCVPFDDPQSNRGAAHRAGLLSKDAPVGYELPLWLDGETPEKAVARVTRRLDEHFAKHLDAVLLGMGEDGHLASLFPGRRALNTRGLAIHVPDSPKPPAERITLGLDLLRTSRRTVLLVTGESKRPALERLLAGDTSLPGNVLPEITVVTDLEVRR